MIELKQVCKAFGDTQVLKSFSATFDTGITFLQGNSGAGKTTVLRLIMGLEQPDSGIVTLPPGRISTVFQEDRLLEERNVLENVFFASGVAPDMEIVYNLELERYLHQPISQLSGGTKRRVALLRALCCPFDVLLLDEPLTGLDSDIKQRAMDAIKARTPGKTVIICTHDPYVVSYLGEGAKIIEVI